MASTGRTARGVPLGSRPAPQVLSLPAWYADVLKRHDQLAAWTTGAIVPPASVWLPGLFNPKAFLTAVMQTYARAHKLPLDVMRFVTDVTSKTVEQARGKRALQGLGAGGGGRRQGWSEGRGGGPGHPSWWWRWHGRHWRGLTPAHAYVAPLAPHVQVTEPAPLGCYIHGLVLEGARWDREDGCLKDSAPGELHQAMPVIQVRGGELHVRSGPPLVACVRAQALDRAVPLSPPLNQPHIRNRAACTPATACQVRPVTADALDLSGCYQCPVYTNMQRANVYSPAVSTFTLRTSEPAHKWVLASVALLLQDDLA